MDDVRDGDLGNGVVGLCGTVDYIAWRGGKGTVHRAHITAL